MLRAQLQRFRFRVRGLTSVGHHHEICELGKPRARQLWPCCQRGAGSWPLLQVSGPSSRLEEGESNSTRGRGLTAVWTCFPSRARAPRRGAEIVYEDHCGSPGGTRAVRGCSVILALPNGIPIPHLTCAHVSHGWIISAAPWLGGQCGGKGSDAAVAQGRRERAHALVYLCCSLVCLRAAEAEAPVAGPRLHILTQPTRAGVCDSTHAELPRAVPRPSAYIIDWRAWR